MPVGIRKRCGDREGGGLLSVDTWYSGLGKYCRLLRILGKSEKERLALNTWGSEIGEWARGDEEEFLGPSRLVSRKLWS
jgi:hypothetical protein